MIEFLDGWSSVHFFHFWVEQQTNMISDNNANDDEIIERLLFIFSDTNYEWMCKQLQTNSESFPLDSLLLNFNSLKISSKISTDKQSLIKAAQSGSLEEFLVFDEDTDSIRRLTPFDFNTSNKPTVFSL